MRRLVTLSAVFALTLGLALTAGCDKEDDVTGPGDGDFIGEPGVPDELALARSIPPMLANGEETVEILATVVDGKKRALEGIGVVFSTTHGSVEPFATTDEDGIARTVLTSAARSTDVTATVTATAAADTAGKPVPGGTMVVMSRTPLTDDLLGEALAERLRDSDDGVMDAAADGVVSDETTVKMLGITLTASATPGTIPADGQSASRVRANLIETTSRIPLQGERVRFGASAGAITGLVTTDATGTATALLTGTTSGTTSNITVYYGNQLTATASVDFSALTLTLSAGVATAQPDGTWETPVVATLVNAEQNPVAGVSVAFTSDSGAIPSPVVTDERGVAATVLYHDAELPQSATVTASFGELSEQLVIDLDPTLVLALEAGMPALVGAEYRTPIFARLTNTDNNPLVGAAIRFSAAQGTIASPVTTGPDGTAVATLVTPALLTSDQVTASFGTLTRQVGVQFEFPLPAEVLVTADPDALPADGQSTTTITAVVNDETGAPVPDGTQVMFSVVSGGGSFGIPTRATEDGVAEATYTAGTQVGYVVIRATAGAASDDVQIQLASLGAGDLALSAAQTGILADGFASTIITATVTDAVGNPVAPGTDVNFSTSRGQLADEKPTDDQGQATVRLRANRYQTGTARVTAQVGGFSEVVDVKFVSEEAVQIVAKEIDNPRIGIKGAGDRESAVVTFVVLDRNSIPVDEDHAVTLDYDIVPIDPPNIDAVVSPASAVTNQDGQANANVLAGVVAGAVEIRAVSGALASQPIRVVIHGDLPDPNHFDLYFDRVNIPGLVYAGYKDSVIALVGDQYGNPVPDSTLVYFTTDYGIVQGSEATNALGEAMVTLVTGAPFPAIPGGDGLVPVTAQTVGKNGDLLATSENLMWSGPTILEITDPDPGFALANGGIITIEFRVRDANNNPITGGSQITVTANDGTLGGQTEITLPDTQDDSYTFFSVTLSDDDAEEDTLRSVTLTVTVTSENGDRVAFLTGTMR